MRFVLGHLFDWWHNLTTAIGEGWSDAMDVWGWDDDDDD